MNRFDIRSHKRNQESLEASEAWRFIKEEISKASEKNGEEKRTLGSFMVIENVDTHDRLEIAYNLKGACTLFYNPDCDVEDMMIAHNGNVGERDRGEYIEFDMDDGRDVTKRVYSYHLIERTQALLGIKTFIESNELDKSIGWHAY